MSVNLNARSLRMRAPMLLSVIVICMASLALLDTPKLVDYQGRL